MNESIFITPVARVMEHSNVVARVIDRSKVVAKDESNHRSYVFKENRKIEACLSITYTYFSSKLTSVLTDNILSTFLLHKTLLILKMKSRVTFSREPTFRA